MRRAITRSAYSRRRNGSRRSRTVSDAYAALAASELSPELAREIVQAAGGRHRADASRARLQTRPSHALSARANGGICKRGSPSEPTLGRGRARPRIVALVGPPGSGKTTTLVKLAVNYGLAARRPGLLLSMDTYRVAAAEQLRSYAAILGVGFQVLETSVAGAGHRGEPRQGTDLHRHPGSGLRRPRISAGLAQFLSPRGRISTRSWCCRHR